MSVSDGSHSSLSRNLTELQRMRSEGMLTLGKLADTLGDKGFGLLLVFLSLPSALPFPAAGLSVPFGILLIMLGTQMLLGRKQPWLPDKVRDREFGGKLSGKLFSGAETIFGKLERFVRPRLKWLNNPASIKLMGLLTVLMGMLMCVPIPLTNTAPAMVIFLIGVGLSEEDGLFSAAACLVGVLATLLYAGVVYVFFAYGSEVLDAAKESIKGWLGM